MTIIQTQASAAKMDAPQCDVSPHVNVLLQKHSADSPMPGDQGRETPCKYPGLARAGRNVMVVKSRLSFS